MLTGQCLSFRRKFLRKCLIRTEIRIVDADNLDFFAAFFDVFRLVLENMYPFRFHRFLQFPVFAGNSRLVIARYIIDRRNGDDLIDEIGCDFRIGPPRIDKISGDDDEIRRRLFHQPDQFFIFFPVHGVVKIGNLNDAETGKGLRYAVIRNGNFTQHQCGILP